MILRPGSITKEDLENVIGNVNMDPSLEKKEDNIKAKAPGMKYTHYSPMQMSILYQEMNRDVTRKNK